MANTYVQYSFANLKQYALIFSKELYSASSSPVDSWGGMLDMMINEGVRQMYPEASGVEDSYVFSTEEGIQTVTLPTGLMFVEAVFMNNTQLTPVSIRALQTNTPTEGTPIWYALYGKPVTTMFMGPNIPDQMYDGVIYYQRTPKDMISDSDSPELPLQYQLAPAYYAAGVMAASDGNSAGQFCLQTFEKMKVDFEKWYRNPSRDRYPVTGRDNNPWDGWVPYSQP